MPALHSSLQQDHVLKRLPAACSPDVVVLEGSRKRGHQLMKRSAYQGRRVIDPIQGVIHACREAICQKRYWQRYGAIALQCTNAL